MEDVRMIRLEAARNLLLTTNLPLKAIAPRVGLGSEYHLSRLLRRHFDLGARELRRRV
jgi:transcriptional regulator GlxA family with amidase domain